MRIGISGSSALLTIATASWAIAADFEVGEGSVAHMSGQAGTTFNGTLIGDWDEVDYPEGSRTLPGIWGGSGNHEIPLDLSLSLTIDFEGEVSGDLSIDIETVPGTCIVQHLDWDLLGKGQAGAAMTVSLLYDTFHTEQPEALFIGGFPIDLPVGNAPITEARFSQGATGAGTATEVPGDPGVYEIYVVVSGVSSMTVDMLGTPWPMEIPAWLVLSGTYSQDGEQDVVDLSATFEVDENADLPDEPLPPIPFELPTIVPPGDVVGVYLNLTPSMSNISAALDASVNAHEVEDDQTPGDANGDGVVNADDILAVLSNWGPCQGCPEDLNGDGTVGVDEILIIIAHWG